MKTTTVLLSLSLLFTGFLHAQSVAITGDVDPGTATSPTWTIGGALFVGDFTTGTLTILDGGKVFNSTGSIGYSGNGTVTVAGAGSEWTNSASLYVGYSGTGRLNVSGGGKVSNNTGYIGFTLGSSGEGSRGEATVSGTGSEWTNAGLYSYIGFRGTGTLTLSEAGRLKVGGGVGNVRIGWETGSNGTLNIGKDDLTTTAGTLEAASVAFGGGTGVVNFNQTDAITFAPVISGGGSVVQRGSGTTTLNGANTYTGGTTVKNGTLAVSGTGRISHAGALVAVGRTSGDNGSLKILNGGKISNSDGNIGSDAGSTGAVTVEGAGSEWTNSGNLFVGEAGAGTLTILNGGKVSNTMSYIGSLATGNGTATVEGAGSEWTNSGNLFVGEAGAGTLTILNGGKVSNTMSYIGSLATGNGTATVEGAGSEWTNNGNLFVGQGGTGRLTVSGGGKVTSYNVSIGHITGSTGEATVSGTGSVWTNPSELFYIGYSGTGTLTLSEAGRLTVGGGAGYVRVGWDTGSNGTLNIGNDSLASTAGTLEAASVSLAGGRGVVNFNQTNAITFAPVISGAGSVVQRGTGTTTIIGANTYTGSTWVKAGTLLVNGSLVSHTIVQNGGTLGGAGTLAKLTLESGGILSPGNSIGTLNAGSFTWNAGGILLFELGEGGLSDWLDLSGDLTKNGPGAFRFSFQDSGWALGETYTLVTFDGTTNFTDTDFSIVNVGDLAGIFAFTDHSLQFTVTAVPEPGTGMTLLLAGLVLSVIRRSRSNLKSEKM